MKQAEKKAKFYAYFFLLVWITHTALFVESIRELASLLLCVYVIGLQAGYYGQSKGFSVGLDIGLKQGRRRETE